MIRQNHRSVTIDRKVCRPVVLVLLLALMTAAALAPSALALTNGQPASLVLGQSDFVNSISAATQSGMNQPQGVAVDPTTGKVFVVDALNHRVLRFGSTAALSNGASAEGVLGQLTFTSSVSATTQSGLSAPAGLAMDSAGRLWVADTQNNRVLRFDSAAAKANGANADGVLGQIDFTSSVTATTQSGLRSPTAVAADSSGRLWVADSGNNRVLRFDSAAAKANGANADGVLGQLDFTSGDGNVTQSKADGPSGVTVDSAGRLWVADTQNNRVLRFDSAAVKANGANADGVLGQIDFTSSVTGTTQSGLNEPFSVAVDSAGRLWVADTQNNRVLWFENAVAKGNGANADGVLGQPDFTGAAAATTQSGLNTPIGVAVDSATGLWVADTQNNRALLFDVSAPEIEVFGNAQAIADGDTTPSVADGTDFGGVALGEEVEHSFTISNTGAVSLTLTGTPAISLTSAVTDSFTVVLTPTTPITATGSTTFTLRFAPTALGVVTATVSIANNDADENPYTFVVQGTGGLLPGYGSTPIPGSAINLGSAPVGSPISTTLMISETGDITLTVTSHSLSGPNAADFSVSPADLSIANGAPAQSLTITCTPSAVGERTTTLTVNHNGPGSPAIYQLSCTGVEAKLYLPIIQRVPTP
jgi:sugar lactone lactonase YvrE